MVQALTAWYLVDDKAALTKHDSLCYNMHDTTVLSSPTFRETKTITTPLPVFPPVTSVLQ